VPGPEPVHEKSLLLTTLGEQRHHVLGFLDGLSEDDDLRRSVLPSGWSCLELVHHLAVDVERFWFRAVMAGEQVELHSGDGGWRAAEDMTAEAVLELYRKEARRSDEMEAARTRARARLVARRDLPRPSGARPPARPALGHHRDRRSCRPPGCRPRIDRRSNLARPHRLTEAAVACHAQSAARPEHGDHMCGWSSRAMPRTEVSESVSVARARSVGGLAEPAGEVAVEVVLIVADPSDVAVGA
jgi:hypothetical protein